MKDKKIDYLYPCGECCFNSVYCGSCSLWDLFLLSYVVLEDDGTDKGGLAFAGEDVEDFIMSVDPNREKIKSIDDLNEALIECGIKPVSLNMASKMNLNFRK